jgi:VIT1/CCC1 family predicted Fe2+/Mn2+ transporter/rubrerythrin
LQNLHSQEWLCYFDSGNFDMSANSPNSESKLDPRGRIRILRILESNWQAEMLGFHTYDALANHESDPSRRAAFRTLASAEEHHANLWAERIQALGGPPGVYRGPEAGEAGSLASRAGGLGVALRRLELDESRDIAKYARQIKELGDEPSIRILQQAIEDERGHYQTLSGLIRNRRPLPQPTPEQAQKALNELLAARDKQHPQAAAWVGDAIYGINDGLGAIFGIVSGVSGATLGNSKFVVIAGMVGMLASALSMGSGAYLAAKSEREIYEAEFAREREAVENNEAEAQEVLSLSYQIRGLPPDEADRFVEHLARDREQFIRILAQERLNTTEDGLRKPLTSAISGALSTAIGATIPVIPFFFLSGYTGVIVAAIVSLAAHFAVGAAKSLVTIRSWWASGLEMTLVGAVEGIVTYLIGLAIGRITGAGI